MKNNPKLPASYTFLFHFENIDTMAISIDYAPGLLLLHGTDEYGIFWLN